MNLFYQPVITEDSLVIPEDETRHILKVLRLKEGDTVHVTDGRGTRAEVMITGHTGKNCLARVVNREFRQEENHTRLHLGMAPPKNSDRFEWFLEKATELGIDEITPLICERSGRVGLRHERLLKVMVSAMKQSLRSWLPILHEPLPFHEILKKEHAGQRFLATCEAGPDDLLWRRMKPLGEITVLIGPEGDFSQKELEQAYQHGYSRTSLGIHRLRTETAGIMVCAAVKLIQE